MDANRLKARKKLEDSTAEEFQSFIKRANLTPRQIQILNYVILQDMYSYEASDELGISAKTISKDLKKIYNKVSKLL